MKAGPKAAVSDEPLVFGTKATGSARFAKFCEKFIRVPKGSGALRPLRPETWQLDMIGSVLDAEVQPRTAGWMLPRGQGKSTLVAALGLYVMLLDGEGSSVVVAATDERQAGIVFGIARRMVELDPELSKRVQVFKERLHVPATDSSFVCLPAEARRLEGLDYTLAILDEAGVANRDTFEVLLLAQGKRERSSLIAIGTPGPNDENPLADLRLAAAEHPGDTSLAWVEHSAAGFEDHPVDCQHCWSLANPALDTFLHRDAMTALLPPKTRESTFRRARLCQAVIEMEGAFMTRADWDVLSTGEPIPDRAEVILSFDGSFNDDSTVLVAATVNTEPHFDVVGVWEKPEGSENWRVPITDVEQAIRDAATRWKVIEVVGDPFRWARSLQLLADEGLPVYEYPQSPPRMTRATADFYAASMNGQLSHSGDPRLTQHIINAVVLEDNRGIRLSKRSRQRSAPKVDLAVAALMAHSRATWRATHRTRRRVVAHR